MLKLKYIDWNFSNTAEAATGVLLALAILVGVLA